MTIQQSVQIDASAQDLYTALTSSSVFAEFTNAPADIEAVVGGSLSCFGGQITGRITELVPNQRIVQEWRAGPWPEGVHSVVEFDIKTTGDAATIELKQSGYPEGSAEHLEGGWHKMYWEPLQAYFKE